MRTLISRGCGRFVVLSAMVFLSAGNAAHAIIDAQLLIGQRQAELSEDDASVDLGSGSEMQFAAHLDPIPLIPIGFGLYAAQTTYSDVESGKSFDSVKGMQAGLELYAWFPLDIANLSPFVKLGLPVYSAYALEGTVAGTEFEGVGEASGVRVAAGLRWSPLPMVGVLGQVDLGRQTMKTKELKATSGATLPIAEESYGFNSTAYLIGVEVGL